MSNNLSFNQVMKDMCNRIYGTNDVDSCLNDDPMKARLIMRCTSYAVNILEASGYPTVNGQMYELVINGIGNAAITGMEG